MHLRSTNLNENRIALWGRGFCPAAGLPPGVVCNNDAPGETTRTRLFMGAAALPVDLLGYSRWRQPEGRIQQEHSRASGGRQADNVSATNHEMIAPYVGTRMKQCHHSAGNVGSSVLPRKDVFDMESNQRRRPLRHAAILTNIARTPANQFP
jgi:hypothetical protein